MVTLPIMKAMTIHAIWSVVAENVPCILGNATVTEFQVNEYKAVPNVAQKVTNRRRDVG